MAFDTAHDTRFDFAPESTFRSREPVLSHQVMELAPPDVLKDWIVLVHSSSDQEVVMLRAWIASLGGTAIRLAQVADADAFIARNPDAHIGLVLEARSPDLEDRIEECLDLRAKFPGCPIILMSETFGKNDFSTERMAVCDASLRSPVSQVAFKLAIPAALSNNLVFQARARELAPDQEAVAEERRARPVADAQAVAKERPRAFWNGRIGEVCMSCGVGLVLSLGLVLMFSA